MSKATFKPSIKMTIEDVGDYNSKISRGTGVIPNKKKKAKDFRKEKHKNSLFR